LFPFQVGVTTTAQQIYEQTDDLLAAMGVNCGLTGVSGGKQAPGTNPESQYYFQTVAWHHQEWESVHLPEMVYQGFYLLLINARDGDFLLFGEAGNDKARCLISPGQVMRHPG
jgi:hypothetical protein